MHARLFQKLPRRLILTIVILAPAFASAAGNDDPAAPVLVKGRPDDRNFQAAPWYRSDDPEALLGRIQTLEEEVLRLRKENRELRRALRREDRAAPPRVERIPVPPPPEPAPAPEPEVAPEPAPVPERTPEPVPVPDPAPEVLVEPVPGPGLLPEPEQAPEPELEPEPTEPMPAPVPEPAPEPEPDAGALHLAGQEALRAGRHEQAAELFEQVLELEPDHAGARIGLAASLYARQDVNGSLKQVEMILAKQPDHPQALGLRGIIERHRGQLDEAEKTLLRAVEGAPDDAQLYNYLAIVLFNRKAYDRARQALEKAVELDPAHPEARFNLAALLASGERPDLEQAREHYRKAIELGSQPDEKLEHLLDL